MRGYLFLALLLGLVLPAPVIATVKLRAIYPNPPGSDDGEWVAVENVGASVSGELYSIRDAVGTVKNFSIESLAVNELRLIYASQSGITLNNAGESVELLSQGILLESSPSYMASEEGKVWLQLDSGWREVSLADFFERLIHRNWSVVEDPQAIDTDELEPSLPTLLPQSLPFDQGQRLPTAAPAGSPPLKPPDRRLPQLKRLPIASAAASWDWPTAPEPDYQAEIATYARWKREALFGSLSLMFAGGCWLILISPSLMAVWQWFRDELML